MFKKFKKLEIPDELLSRVQDNVDTAINQLPNTQIINGVLLKGISLDSAITNQISHKLGRNLIGWQIIRIRGNATVWDSQDSNNRPDVLLALNCSSDVQVDLWVF